MLAQVAPALHYLVEGSLLAAVEAIGVVDLAGAVATDTDKKIVFLEKGAPLVIQEDSVGLKRVFNGLPGPTVLLHDFDGLSKELDLHEGGLAALPGNRHGRRAMRIQELLDVEFECFVRHPMLFVRIQGVFGQEKTIGAINVAG